MSDAERRLASSTARQSTADLGRVRIVYSLSGCSARLDAAKETRADARVGLQSLELRVLRGLRVNLPSSCEAE